MEASMISQHALMRLISEISDCLDRLNTISPIDYELNKAISGMFLNLGIYCERMASLSIKELHND